MGPTLVPPTQSVGPSSEYFAGTPSDGTLSEVLQLAKQKFLAPATAAPRRRATKQAANRVAHGLYAVARDGVEPSTFRFSDVGRPG